MLTYFVAEDIVTCGPLTYPLHVANRKTDFFSPGVKHVNYQGLYYARQVLCHRTIHSPAQSSPNKLLNLERASSHHCGGQKSKMKLANGLISSFAHY